MALFFDANWFDAKLAAAHLSRADLARALGLSDGEIVEMWKDQRELSARHVAIMAALLNANADEVAEHAGISTPIPAPAASDMDARLTRIEHALEELKTMVRALKDRA
jgi:transcriptional regulator with XRE-family HTH domain